MLLRSCNICFRRIAFMLKHPRTDPIILKSPIYGSAYRFLNISTTRLLTSDVSSTTHKPKEVLVYKAPLTKRIKIVKMLSLGSSLLGFALQPYVCYTIWLTSPALSIFMAFTSTLFLSTPFLLQLIIKKYVTELIFNPGSKIFTARTLTLLNRRRELRFTADDVSVPTLPGILTSLLVKKTPLFVDSNMIECPDSYAHMMGYDKPFDFEMSVEEDQEDDLEDKKRKAQ